MLKYEVSRSVYRVFREECVTYRENVPWINLHRYTNHSYSRLWTVMEITMRKNMWSSCGSSYCTRLKCCLLHYLHKCVLETIAKPSHAEASVLCKVLGILRTSCMKLELLLFTDVFNVIISLRY